MTRPARGSNLSKIPLSRSSTTGATRCLRATLLVCYSIAEGGNILCVTLSRFLSLLLWLWGSLLSAVSTLYLLNESQEHLALSRLHPMLTLVPGYVLKEFGMS